MIKFWTWLVLLFYWATCVGLSQNEAISLWQNREIRTGAERHDLLLPLLRNKRIGIVSNVTGVVGPHKTLLADTLLESGVKVVKLFSPEHGYRGEADAGTSVKSRKDNRSGLPVVSLYGNNKKPTPEQLQGIDLLLFDLQDVGTRFYTYISTMHYVMEAAAENNLEVVICDRPNPNDFVDGPILEPAFRSFVGMHPIPILHGLTVGELAMMINGEKWLKGGIQCTLFVIPVQGWKHGQPYAPVVPPSPNLKDYIAIRRYPSLCFFEATILSVGRGTNHPFRVLGYPNPQMGSFRFTPKSQPGAAKPKYNGQECYGTDYTQVSTLEGLRLFPLIEYQLLCQKMGIKMIDRKRAFDILAGTDQLRLQLERGDSEQEIRSSWQAKLQRYKELRRKYLIYTDYAEDR